MARIEFSQLLADSKSPVMARNRKEKGKREDERRDEREQRREP
jgi:hypothetical protein